MPNELLNQAIAAIADPTRRAILELLVAKPRTVTEIVAEFSISQPSISEHLRILRDAGWASAEANGRERIYRLNPVPLSGIVHWMDRLDIRATTFPPEVGLSKAQPSKSPPPMVRGQARPPSRTYQRPSTMSMEID